MALGKIIKNEDVLKFFLAGKSKFTLIGESNRFTYYIMCPKDKGVLSQTHRFVKVSDSSRGNDFTYIGFLKLVQGSWKYIFGQPRVSKPSFNSTSLEVKAFAYVFNRAQDNLFDPRVEIWHEGKCACCGKALTTPLSMNIGWGPSCLKKLKAELAGETQLEYEAR